MPVQPNDVPLYVRLQNRLRDDIRAGRLPAGTPLPSEREMEVAYGVSRITVRRALDELAREGLLDRGQGRVTRVIEPLTAAVRTRIEDELAASLQLGRGMAAEVLSYAWRLPEPAIATLLDTPANERVLHVERLRRQGARAMLHTIAHVPSDIGALLPRTALQNATMLDLLADRGVVAASAQQDMFAAACPPNIAGSLGLPPGAPVFVIDRSVRDGTDRVIQHLVATFRGDGFTYRVSSGRVSSARQEKGHMLEIVAAGRVT